MKPVDIEYDEFLFRERKCEYVSSGSDWPGQYRAIWWRERAKLYRSSGMDPEAWACMARADEEDGTVFGRIEA